MTRTFKNQAKPYAGETCIQLHPVACHQNTPCQTDGANKCKGAQLKPGVAVCEGSDSVSAH